MIIDPRYEPYTSGTGPEPNPRLGYQARPGRSRSRTWRVRVGQSGSLPGPCSTNLDRSRSREDRSRTGRLRVGRSGNSTRGGPGPEPDLTLSFQARPGRSRSRTWGVRVGQSGSLPSPCSNPIGAGPATAKTGAGQDVSESDRAGALHTADQGRSRTYDRAIELGSGWAGAGPAAIPVLLRRAGTAVRQEEATNKDEGLSPGGPARWARTRMDS